MDRPDKLVASGPARKRTTRRLYEKAPARPEDSEHAAPGPRTGAVVPEDPERAAPGPRPVPPPEPASQGGRDGPEEPVHRVGRPPGGRPARPDRLVAQGEPRQRSQQGGGRRHRSVPPSALRRSTPLRRRRSATGLLTPLLVVVVLAAAVGAGVVVWQWVSGPVTTGLRLAAGAGGPSDEQFPGPSAGGDGSNQVLNAIAAVGGTVVAVGADTTSPVPRPLFLVSTDDGDSWRLGEVGGPADGESAATTVTQVAGGAGQWLAVGDEGPGAAGRPARGLWTSPDGVTWTAVHPVGLAAFRSGDRIADIARTKSGFVAVGETTLGDGTSGPAAWISPDGRSWTRVGSRDIAAPDRARAIRAVVAKGDAVVALANPGEGDSASIILRSPDGGRNWLRSGAAVPGVTPAPGALAVGRDGFVLVPTRQRTAAGDVWVYCSPEGAQWRHCGSIGGLGRDSTGVRRLTSSAKGVTAVADAGGDRYVVYAGTTGRDWAQRSVLGVPGTLRALAVSDKGTVIVGGDRRVAEVDNRPVLMTAADGGSARQVRLDRIEGLARAARETARVAAADGRFVAVGTAAGEAGIWTSTDGGSWGPTGTADILGGPRRQALADVAHGAAGWVAAGSTMSDPASVEPLLVTSADARSWRRVPLTGGLSPGDDTYFLAPHAVAAGPAGYLLAGEERGKDGIGPVFWFTADLRRFTRAERLPAGGAGVRIHDVAATGSGFVAVGASGTAERENGVVWVSDDGLNWTARKRVVPPEAGSAGLRHVAVLDGRIIAVGEAREGGSRRPFVARSDDGGSTWDFVWLPAERAAAVQDLAVTSAGMVAVGWEGTPGEGDSRAWISDDGLAWGRQELDHAGLSGMGFQQLGAVAIAGDTVVALGRSTTYSSDHITIWRTAFSR